ncbi:MAG: ATP-binding protein, partial [Thermoanaerobaculia bacterium]
MSTTKGVPTMAESRLLPAWAEELRRRYLRGESTMFLLHGNVYDGVIDSGRMLSLAEFLTDVLLKESKETIALYNAATGVRFVKRSADVGPIEDYLLSQGKEKIFSALERLVTTSTKAAVILEYAEALAPAGDPSFQGDADRAAIVNLHRWSFLPQIERGDNVIILIAENLTELAPKLVSNPKISVVEIPMPD